ncbi:MAG: fructosamine kinase family protein [Betaproteobacteria bacterium]|nr:fructosamine kinase family protein [Betaproteobacteria bacterium]
MALAVRSLAEAITQATGRTFVPASSVSVAGGCIHRAADLRGVDGRRYFVKLNDADKGSMFAAEAEGLAEIAASHSVRTPLPVAQGVADGSAFLALEWLDLGGRGSAVELGRALARMHRTRAGAHGWHRDNWIGATPQINPITEGWVAFWGRARLGVQLELAAAKGCPRGLVQSGERLLASLAAFFPGYAPFPSLLHGDLWGGNYGYAGGQPVLFDPAVYYGDRETDLAMTELFGGFPAGFHASYRESFPLDPGYPVRKGLYNLYHVLNHFNLFGGGYARQAQDMAARLLAEAG